MTDNYILNLAYFLVAICIMYKMSWIARMTGHIHGWEITGLRFAGAGFALIVLAKSGHRFVDPYDAATLFDVVREFTLCIFLAFAIAVLRLRTGHW